MALSQFLSELEALVTAAESAFQSAADAAALETARIEYLGAKSGRIKTVQKGLGGIDKTDKPVAGQRFNEVKARIESAFSAAQERCQNATAAAAVKAVSRKAEKSDAVIPPGAFDPSESPPGCRLHLGRLHPITQTIETLKEIMGRLGFSVADGPEIEDEWHNFQALNIPASHPARDPLENFYLSMAEETSGAGPMLLRSQTSTVQIRVMENRRPPVRIIALGRVYRPDTADATHFPMFHQIEGLLVDRQVTMADLKSVLRMFAMSYFGGEVHIRFRPSFFPFTEPSVEVDMQWHDRWIEMGGAGMVDPNVLRAVGYDPEEFSGFAFGIGIERVCMRRHNLTDIRELYKNDVRFLEQF
ncbi:MAG: phenylalanine--tRNA ligase subunit alpha [Planctomycetia bacterium]|nr:phenylalanine--tRNA ligase subunit alpha [Planctomycetia bacterium]